MAKDLLALNQQFRAAIRQLDRTLQSLPDEYRPKWTLEQEIEGPTADKFNRASYSQPLCTAIQIGIVEVLRRWGVFPSAVIGHSSGEIAAAYAAGKLGASQAIIVAYLRGLAVEQFENPGAMLAVGLGPDAIDQILEKRDLKEQVCVACVNDADNVTLSGTEDAVEVMYLELQAQRKFVRQLETGGKAYHSHLMQDVGGLYEQLLEPFLETATDDQSQVQSPDLNTDMVHMYSTAGSTDLIVDECSKASYWRKNLESTVQFSSALESLAKVGDYHLIEIGPHHALKGPIGRTLAKQGKKNMPYCSTLARNENSDTAMKKLAGVLFSYGHTLEWTEINGFSEYSPALVDLPPYPWCYSTPLLWEEPRASIDLRNRKHVRHELLGSQQLAGSGLQWAWRNVLNLNEVPWLRDHRLGAQIVFPAAGYLAMVTEALSQVLWHVDTSSQTQRSLDLRDIAINTALVIPDVSDVGSHDVELHTVLKASRLSPVSTSNEWYEFAVSSWTDGIATEHCAGYIRATIPSVNEGSTLVQLTESHESWAMDRWYQRLREVGLNFGPAFQSVTSFSTHGSRRVVDAVGETVLAPLVTSGSDYMVHPIAIDACIQSGIFGGTGGNLNALQAWVPVFISRCRIQGRPHSESGVTIHTQSAATGLSRTTLDCTLRDRDGYPLVDLKEVRMTQFQGDLGQDELPQRHPCLRVRWKPDITRLDSGSQVALSRYICSVMEESKLDSTDDMRQAVVALLLDLVGHKNPKMRVLEVSNQCTCRTKDWLDLLDQGTDFPRYSSWDHATILEGGNLEIKDDPTTPFDLAVIMDVSYSTYGI